MLGMLVLPHRMTINLLPKSEQDRMRDDRREVMASHLHTQALTSTRTYQNTQALTSTRTYQNTQARGFQFFFSQERTRGSGI